MDFRNWVKGLSFLAISVGTLAASPAFAQSAQALFEKGFEPLKRHDYDIQIGETFYRKYGVATLDRRSGSATNPFVQQTCPGVSLFEHYE